MKNHVLMAAIAAGLIVPTAMTDGASASILCTPTRERPCPVDRETAARQAEEKRKFDEEQRRKREQQRQQQIAQQEQMRRQQQQQQQAYWERQRQMQQQQQQQQQLAAQQRRAQEDAMVRSAGAVRVNSYAGTNNRPYYTAFNNTPVTLRVYISYVLRGANGAFQNGTETATVSPNGRYDWPYWSGSVDTSKPWNVQVTNVRWERVN